MTSYFETTAPGSGLRSPARAWVHSDAPTLSLNGDWRFRLSPMARISDAAAAPDFDDSGWDTLPVPSHWVLQGDGEHGHPAYTNVQFPFPIDPPRVPDENPTGDHRRRFDLPADWADLDRVLLRFDGVESTYRVWLNGDEVGVGQGSRLVQEFDVTSRVRPGENVLVVRVHQWSAASYVEDQDQWWMPGIFRDVTLIGRPVGALDDVWIRAEYDHRTGAGTIVPEVVAAASAFPIRVTVPELDLDLSWDGPTDVAPIVLPEVEPWSAERPRLYDVVVASSGERVSLRLGFRTVVIEGDIFTVNGARVLFHGVNRHETHPVRGRVFDEEHARADMAMMKRHNLNAIRTSHYPPHPRVLDLADELGFWVIDECDIETHGFEHLGWVGNPSDDPDWAANYLDRIERTVERDKNHPSIVIWSLGNEAGTGRNLAANSAWVHRRDPGRPVHYEGDHAGAYTDVYSRMYSNLQETESIGSDTIPGPLLGATPAEGAHVRTMPFILCEYVHAMGNGPGAIDDYEALFETYPRLHGGFVWEWRDHGILTRTADGKEFYGYGGDFGEVVHDGNFVMDGLVLSDDTPTPSLAEYARVVQPIGFGPLLATDDGHLVEVRNKYHDSDTAHLSFGWVLEADGHRVSSGPLEFEPIAAGELGVADLGTVVHDIALDGPDDVREWWLTLTARLAADTEWAESGHVVASHQVEVTPVGTRGSAVRARVSAVGSRQARPSIAETSTSTAADTSADIDTSTSTSTSAAPDTSTVPDTRTAADTAALGTATFDPNTGALRSIGELEISGPQLELWRAPTDNDRGPESGSYMLGDPELTFGRGIPGPSSAEMWRRAGLDRLVHRLDSVAITDDTVTTVTRISAANSADSVTLICHWDLLDGRLHLTTDIVPTRGWAGTWPRTGIRFTLPGTMTDAAWFGTGPAESYPDSMRAASVGRFASSIDDLAVRYSRPQETGHRSELRELTIDGEITLTTVPDRAGHRPGFTLSRHTPHQLDAARHPHELADDGRLYLYLDAHQHGLGSRACGIDVLPVHANRPADAAIEVFFDLV